MTHSTPQEEFWAGQFGTDYITRNQSEQLLAANLAFFSRVLERTGKIVSCVELGANVVIIGDITIGNNVTIGAGSVVLDSIPDNALVVGEKARVKVIK